MNIKQGQRTAGSLTGRLTATLIVLGVLTSVFSSSGFAQTGDCYPGSCSAQNFNLVDIYLGDINGNALQEGFCDPGDPVTAYIWVEFLYTQAASRQSLYLEYDLWQDNVFIGSFFDCFYQGQQIPGAAILNIQTIQWVCGTRVELKDIYLSWGGPNAQNCICSNAQCYNQPLILVAAPLVPDFDVEVVCTGNEIQQIQFTDQTTGGEVPYAYVWNFGLDGTGNTTAKNPLVTYTSTGTKTVTLQITDSNVPPRVRQITKDIIVADCPDPAISLTKSASPLTYGAVDDVITYTIEVENTGNVPLTDVVVSDPQAATGPDYDSGDDGDDILQPGEIWVYTATYTITLQDLQNGSFTNTASVTSRDPEDEEITDDDSATVTAIRANLAIAKADAPDPVIAGQTLTFTLTINNLGPNTAENVSVADVINPAELSDVEFSTDGGGSWNPWISPYAAGNLANGGSFTILIRGTVLPTLAQGSVIGNTSTVSSDTFDQNLANNSASTQTDVNTSADVSITKTGAPNPPVSGQLRTYTITVSNAGPSQALNVQVADTVPASILNPQFSTDGGGSWNPWVSPLVYGTLGAGDSFSFLIRGTINPNLPANTAITNTAVVSSSTPDPNLANNTSTDTTNATAVSDLSIVKSQINPGALPAISVIAPSTIVAGTKIYYYLQAVNNGPSFAINLLIEDIVPAEITNAEFSLNFGNSWQVWNGTRTLPAFSFPGVNDILIRGDVDPGATGSLVNTGEISSDTPDPDLSNNSSTLTTTITQSADLVLSKEELITPVVIGGPIDYLITVFNAGPSDATDVEITDVIDPAIISGTEYSLDNGGSWTSPWPGSLNVGPLAYQDTIQLRIRGTIVDASPDPNVDPIPNTASVVSAVFDPNLANNTQTILTPLDEEADLSIVKTGPVSVVAGTEIAYTLLITNNSGTFDAENVIVTDTINPVIVSLPEYSADGGGTWLPWTGSLNIGTLNAGDSYTLLLRGQVLSNVTQAIPNTAQVSSDTPDSDPTNDVSSIVTPVVRSADLEVVKLQIDPAILPIDPINLPANLMDLAIDPSVISAGEEIYYLLVYSNYGPSDATNYLIYDDVPGDILNPEASRCQAGFSPWVSPFNAGTVVAGGRCVIVIRGQVSSDATGELTNTAIVDSDVPDPDDSNNESTVVTALDNEADLAITKTDAPDPVIAGQTLTYTITVSNQGPADAQNVVVTDPVPATVQNPEFSLDDGGIWNAWTGIYAHGGLAVGDSFELLIRGTVNPAAPQGSQISNTATVEDEGDTTDPNPNNNTATAVTTVNAVADVIVGKLASPEPVTAGQILTFTITVENFGPSVAANVSVTDILPAGLTPVSALPSVGTWVPPVWNVGNLPVGIEQTLVITATVNELANGTLLNNTAIAASTTVDPNLNNNSASTVTTVVANPALTIVKEITSGSPYAAVGDVINYSFTITNTGDVTFNGPITVVDNVIGVLANCAAGPLAPNASVQCAGSYVVNQGDLNNGSVTNQAYATALYANAVVTSNTDDATAIAQRRPAIAIDKKALPLTYSAVDQVISYTIIVENTGNLTLSSVSVTDPLTGLDQTIATLQPGEVQIFNESHTITQENLDDGSVVNTATASGNAPGEDSPVSDEDSETVTAIQTPELTVTKTADPETASAAGEEITYTIVVENTGNVTLYDIVVSDPLTELDETIDILAPGDFETFVVTYTISQDDMDEGSVVNTASANGYTQNETPVSGQDDATVTAEQAPELSVTKTASPETYSAAGAVITYTIVVENTGNVTLYDIVVNDPLTGLDETIDVLAPGESETYIETYTITQPDMDGGSVANTATAAGIGPDEEPVEASDSETVTANQNPDITVTKTAAPTTYSAAGQNITYTIVVQNTGNVTLTNIAVTDPLTGLNTNIASLAPNASQNYVQNYTITQANVNNGTVVNTASATGTDPNQNPVSDSDSATVTAIQSPGLTVTKTAAPQTYSAADQIITYTIVVQNTGNVTLTNIAVTDPLTGLNTNIASLEPGESQNYAQNYTITQTNLNNGSVVNTASATGTDPNQNPVSDSDSATVTASQGPGLTVTKTASPQTYSASGQIISYAIVVQNTGNVTLSNIAVTDPLTGLNTNIASLDPGASQNYAQNYTITQANVNSGSVVNTASATGTDPNQNPVSDSDSATVTAIQSPGLTVTKTASPQTYSAPDQIISYTIVVQNTGNVTLTNIAVTDPLTGLNTNIASLDPGASQNYAQNYTITQTDINNGSVVNTASATGTDPNQNPVSDSDSATVTANQGPGLSLTKTAFPLTYSGIDDEITYTVFVQNTGNVTLSNVSVVDPLTGLNAVIASLIPGASQSFEEVYAATEDDVEAGVVVNTATATATLPGGGTISDEDDATVQLLVVESFCDLDAPYISYFFGTDTEGEPPAETGLTIEWLDSEGTVVLTITNAPLSGEILWPGAEVDENGWAIAWPGWIFVNGQWIEVPSTLVDGTSIRFSFDPDNPIQVVYPPKGETCIPGPTLETGLKVTKTAAPQTYNAIGQVITYTIVVENMGNVELYDVYVVDPLTGLDEYVQSLVPGEEVEFTETYEIEQADLNAGSVVNTASATALSPEEEELYAEDSATVTSNASASLSLTKTASPQTYSVAGTVITYTIVVRNTGNVLITNIVVTDPLTGLNSTIASLAPGASQTRTTTYTITPADVNSGQVVNTARATGNSPTGAPVSAEDSETVTANRQPGVEVSKTASPQTYNAAGDVITYTIVVSNTGNVVLSNIVVTDPLTGLNTTIASLAPGASETFTETYTITQADVDAGSVTNVARATGDAPGDESVSDEDGETVTTERSPSLSVTKAASPQTYSAVGEVITYTITVVNTGNVTLTGIVVTDPLTGLSTTIASLAPGASEVFTETHTITQADLNAGSIVNVASASGNGPDGSTVTDEDEETATANQNAALSVTKTASPQTYSAVDDEITYTITVTNTGNVTVSNIVVSDPLTGLNTTIASLAPGASETFTETYTITQADLDAGSVLNSVTAAGVDPNDDPVRDEETETVTTDVAPELTVTKTVSPAFYSAVGDVITYTIVVENTGPVTVTNITVTDPLTGLSATIASLAPGASETFTETYTITAADVEGLSVVNTAAATFVFRGDPYEYESTVTLPFRAVVVEEDTCCQGFNLFDPANIFIGVLALLALLIATLFMGGDIITPINFK